ncbi:MAG TPA: hypothetical protein VKN18_01245 [Blastocatellia bacterium]|nr:hypothetical protein [Blastocatellia bacterium]
MSTLGSKHLWPLLTVGLVILVSLGGCIIPRGQRYQNFTVSTPLRQNQILVLGFMGGREPWDNEKRNVRKLALKLRSMNDPTICVETVENKKRFLAIELINNAFDKDHDGILDERERSSVRLIVYGQSFGGAAVVKLARQLKKMEVPIALTVQIDSVGRNDSIIPDNVIRAANLFQRNGWFIKGEPEIRAGDPARTLILGNFEFDYSNKNIDISGVSIMKKAFRVAHTKMEYDQQVWDKVESLILDTIQQLR